MARPAHPDAMKSAKPSPTRMAPPVMPDQFPAGGRYLAYTSFDATGIVYLLLGFVDALRQLLGAVGLDEVALGFLLAPEAHQHLSEIILSAVMPRTLQGHRFEVWQGLLSAFGPEEQRADEVLVIQIVRPQL